MSQLVDEVFSSGKSLVDDLHDLETVWTPYVSFGECFHIFFVGVELFVNWRDYCRFLLVAGCMGHRLADGRWWLYCQCRLCWWLCLSRNFCRFAGWSGLASGLASPDQPASLQREQTWHFCLHLPSFCQSLVGWSCGTSILPSLGPSPRQVSIEAPG